MKDLLSARLPATHKILAFINRYSNVEIYYIDLGTPKIASKECQYYTVILISGKMLKELFNISRSKTCLKEIGSLKEMATNLFHVRIIH